MAAESQPHLLTADLLRDVCRHAFKDVRVHHNLHDMAIAMLPGLVSFECSATDTFSLHIELDSYEFWVIRMAAFGDHRFRHVQIRYRQRKHKKSVHSYDVAVHSTSTLAMLKEIFTRIRELAAGDGC